MSSGQALDPTIFNEGFDVFRCLLRAILKGGLEKLLEWPHDKFNFFKFEGERDLGLTPIVHKLIG